MIQKFYTIKCECRVELSLIDVKLMSHRCTSITDGITDHLKIGYKEK